MTTYDFLTGRQRSWALDAFRDTGERSKEQIMEASTRLRHRARNASASISAASMSAASMAAARFEQSSMPGRKRLQKKPTVEWETIISEFQEYEGHEAADYGLTQHPSMLQSVSDGESNLRANGVNAAAADAFSVLVAGDQSPMLHRALSSVIFGSGFSQSPMTPIFGPL